MVEMVRLVVIEKEGQRFRDRAAEEREKLFENREIDRRCLAEFVRVLEEHRHSVVGVM
ncbi:hypothetical protein LINGRAHAP2_LOCUS22754 [Linum grandiflorum]